MCASIVTCVRLKAQVAEMREKDTRKLRQEYQRLLQGLDTMSNMSSTSSSLVERASPLPNNGVASTSALDIPEDLLQQAIPTQIKKATAFLTFMRAVVAYLKKRLDVREVVLESPDFFVHKVCIALLLKILSQHIFISILVMLYK